MGFKVAGFIRLTILAPKNEDTNEATEMINKSSRLNRIFREYWNAAIEVPDNAAILLVPKIVANGVFGKVISKAGI